jgi:glycine cleavage system H protein
MNFPDDLRYTQEHEWVRVDGNIARVGITDYAQDALGDVVYVDLPQVGVTVAEANTDLSDAPQMINEDPYGKGWIFAVEISDPGQVEGLMDAAAYQAFLEQEH